MSDMANVRSISQGHQFTVYNYLKLKNDISISQNRIRLLRNGTAILMRFLDIAVISKHYRKSFIFIQNFWALYWGSIGLIMK